MEDNFQFDSSESPEAEPFRGEIEQLLHRLAMNEEKLKKWGQLIKLMQRISLGGDHLTFEQIFELAQRNAETYELFLASHVPINALEVRVGEMKFWNTILNHPDGMKETTFERALPQDAVLQVWRLADKQFDSVPLLFQELGDVPCEGLSKTESYNNGRSITLNVKKKENGEFKINLSFAVGERFGEEEEIFDEVKIEDAQEDVRRTEQPLSERAGLNKQGVSPMVYAAMPGYFYKIMAGMLVLLILGCYSWSYSPAHDKAKEIARAEINIRPVASSTSHDRSSTTSSKGIEKTAPQKVSNRQTSKRNRTPDTYIFTPFNTRGQRPSTPMASSAPFGNVLLSSDLDMGTIPRDSASSPRRVAPDIYDHKDYRRTIGITNEGQGSKGTGNWRARVDDLSVEYKRAFTGRGRSRSGYSLVYRDEERHKSALLAPTETKGNKGNEPDSVVRAATVKSGTDVKLSRIDGLYVEELDDKTLAEARDAFILTLRKNGVKVNTKEEDKGHSTVIAKLMLGPTELASGSVFVKLVDKKGRSIFFTGTECNTLSEEALQTILCEASQRLGNKVVDAIEEAQDKVNRQEPNSSDDSNRVRQGSGQSSKGWSS